MNLLYSIYWLIINWLQYHIDTLLLYTYLHPNSKVSNSLDQREFGSKVGNGQNQTNYSFVDAHIYIRHIIHLSIHSNLKTCMP